MTTPETTTTTGCWKVIGCSSFDSGVCVFIVTVMLAFSLYITFVVAAAVVVLYLWYALSVKI